MKGQRPKGNGSKSSVAGDLLRIRKHRRWFALVMKTGQVHVREYLGPPDFRASVDFHRYGHSPLVDTLYPPTRISVVVDHRAAMLKKLARPVGYREGVRARWVRRANSRKASAPVPVVKVLGLTTRGGING